MRRVAVLLTGLAIVTAGIAVASIASATKTETRWVLTHVGALAWRLAVAALAFALSLTPAGCLTASSEREDAGPSYPYHSRDGAWVAFTSDRSGTDELYVARLGAAADRITDTDGDVGDLAWSPDGSKIVFSSLNDEEQERPAAGGLHVVNRDGSALRQITRGEDHWPCWTADGGTIVFVRGDHVRGVAPDGTAGRRLVANAAMPACSPTEPAIAFVTAAGALEAGMDLRVLDLRSGSTRELPGPRAATDDASPSWSPDGSRIVWEAQRNRIASDPVIEEGPWATRWYLAELYVVGLDGGEVTQLTENTVGDCWPDWLPDGRIFFRSNRAGPDDLTNTDTCDAFLMNADGTGVETFPWDPNFS